ncbi:MAG TPA: hypothetical protein VMR41_03405 [Patescibacteria group bacterium]|nr:hypothetical protein [Patescibacteria group bacterium]
MLISPAIFIFILAALIILAITLLVFVFFYTKSLSQLLKLQKENVHLKQNMNVKSVKALQNAQEKTQAIIEQANKKAEEILQEANLFSSDQQNLVKSKLNAIIDNQTKALNEINTTLDKEYEKEFTETEREAIKLFGNVTKSFSDTASAEISDFKTVLENETVGSQKIVEQKIEEAYTQVEAEIKNYKEKKLAEIDGMMNQRIKTVANYVLGNGLTIEQHEILIRQAMDELKKQMK